MTKDEALERAQAEATKTGHPRIVRLMPGGKWVTDWLEGHPDQVKGNIAFPAQWAKGAKGA